MATQISTLTTLNNNTGSYNCFIPIVDPNLALDSRNLKIRFSTHNEMFSNNFAVGNLSSYANYFGTGADGDLTISSSAQISSSFNNVLDGDIVVKNYKSLTVNGGVTLLPLKRCRGLIIYCTGDLTVNGTISMTAKGGGVGNKIATPLGIASVTEARYDLLDASLYFNNLSSSISGKGIPTPWNWAPSGNAWFRNYKIRVPLSGSVAGGAGGTGAVVGPTAGTAGIFSCGGGGGGGGGGGAPSGRPSRTGGAGGRGTIFAGGGGGSGASASGPGPGVNGLPGFFDVGGVVNPSNPAPTPLGNAGAGANSSGASGLLIIIVRGAVSINGTISSNGSTGNSSPAPQTAGGAGSGGGRIIIIYGNTFTNNGSITTNGGSGGTGNDSGQGGASGGAGAITIRKAHI